MDELEIEKIFAIKRENFRISVECGRLNVNFSECGFAPVKMGSGPRPAMKEILLFIQQ